MKNKVGRREEFDEYKDFEERQLKGSTLNLVCTATCFAIFLGYLIFQYLN